MYKLLFKLFEFFFGSRNLEPKYKKKINEITLRSGDKYYICFLDYKIYKFSIGFINFFEKGTLTLYLKAPMYNYYDLDLFKVPREFENYSEAKKSLDLATERWLKHKKEELEQQVTKVELIK